MRNMTRLWILSSLVMIILSVAAENRPNFVFILTDDQGWAQTSVPMMKGRSDSKSDVIQTPNLERFAERGMVFSNGYAPGSMCTVSRFGLLYGRSPARLMRSANKPQLERRPYLSDYRSLPQTLKAIDPTYRTAHLGKWHMGETGTGRQHTPETAGFDVSDGPTGNGNGNHKGQPVNDDPKFVFDLTKRAVAFMKEQKDAGMPFYLQLSHYANHHIAEARAETLKKYESMPDDPRHGFDIYNAMTEYLDESIGLLMDAIDELGLADNTYVVFMADNGTRCGKHNNLPLRGSKSTIWEGGIRVPTLIYGPGIDAGSYCDVPMVGTDLLPTFADYAGGLDQLEDNVDGTSIRPVLENGGKGTLKRKSPMVFHFPHLWEQFSVRPWSAIRKGNLKLIRYWDGDQEVQLFNLEKDLEEAQDIAVLYPEQASMLERELLDYLADVKAEKTSESWTFDDPKAGKSQKKKPKGRKK